MKLRIQFSKYGPLRFIGHLDVMRFFQKAIRRAGIDIAYSSGFSPHQIMSFASPLGLGVESRGEYLDIQVNEPMKIPMNAQEMKDRLDAVCVEGIEIVLIVRLPENAGNAMASVAAASYTAAMKQDESVLKAGVSLSDFSCLESVIPAFLDQEQIFITKETKKGVSQMDIRPGIFSLSADDGALEFQVDASSAGNIKPYALLDALLSFAGKDTPPFWTVQFTRLETWTRAEADGRLISSGRRGGGVLTMVKEASLPKKSKSVQILLKEKNRILSLLLSDGRLATLSAWPDETGDEGKGALAARLNSIYVGKVMNVAKNINAAFVELTKGQRAFLPLSHMESARILNRKADGRILAGDELLVQVDREAVKTKGAGAHHGDFPGGPLCGGFSGEGEGPPTVFRKTCRRRQTADHRSPCRSGYPGRQPDFHAGPQPDRAADQCRRACGGRLRSPDPGSPGSDPPGR